MTLEEFTASLAMTDPPAGFAPALAALWWTHQGKWDRAHRIVMDEEGRDCAWVHAHLHRVEGDLGNARYWYRQALRSVPAHSLEEERTEIARILLGAR
jgi:hypothetical protein